MILTCPACDTKYVVKDGAIPAGGRQVRCASCKHSWHQEPEIAAGEAEQAPDGNPAPGQSAEPAYEAAGSLDDRPDAGNVVAASEATTANEAAHAEWETTSDPQEPELDGRTERADAAPIEPVVEAPAAAVADTSWQMAPSPAVEEEEFVGYAPIGSDEERPPHRWPKLIGLILLIAAAAAAFWFLAPAQWKARAGIAQAGATPLQLMITTSDRQPLESGNELVAISGRVINPTDHEQEVPPIRAELRDKQSKAVVHRWTIAPPARTLAPRSSASFNSAEVDVPKGGDELTVTLGG